MTRPAALLFSIAFIASLGAAESSLPPLPIDQGAIGAWQKIQKLQSTASILHTTAHPDDEQSGMLTWASRGAGARTMLLTLNRGQAGDNAIGPELFDALGLIRTDELARAGQYYGLDEQFFTQVADYGYSKRLDEAFSEWDREALLRDMVRVIRHARPLVVVSRWQGSSRDGHGQHQAAGAITPDAVAAAGDASRFPELEKKGLRPWKVPKLYLGGAREDEPWHVRVDAGAYDPVLGESYQNLGRIGLSLQRSQTGGRLNTTPGPAPIYYTRAGAPADAGREKTFFDGLDVSIEGAARWAAPGEEQAAREALSAVAAEARAAREAFSFTDPPAAASALARGLAAVRQARERIDSLEIRHVLDVKERQFEDALAAVLGLQLTAVAQPAGTPEPRGPFAAFAPPPVLDAVTPGQAIDVRVTFASRGPATVAVSKAELRGPGSLRVPVAGLAGRTIAADAPHVGLVSITVPPDSPLTRPYFSRGSIADTRYTVVDDSGLMRAFAPPLFSSSVRYEVNGVPATLSAPVMRREAQLPYGYALRELEVLPPVALSVSPAVLVVPAGGPATPMEVQVEALAYASAGAAGTLTLKAPPGWTVSPGSAPFTLEGAGARVRQSFRVTPSSTGAGEHWLDATAGSGGRQYSTGYQVIRHRDLPLRYLVRDARARVSAFDVARVPGVRVGYVMGVGDELPAALEQLGAQVTLLDREALASGDLGRFQTIVTGTRAYAVRDDLRANNRRLLDWVQAGGNMIVLYNTPEFVPAQFAPYPGELPNNAEEVSEQRAPVEILAPAHRFFTTPNRITAADFDGWIEQRGSKFFSTWDSRYTALVSSHDQGQPPQQGGWLTADYGKGTWTYMAYALHRQVPYGVPGAYRILANLIAR